MAIERQKVKHIVTQPVDILSYLVAGYFRKLAMTMIRSKMRLYTSFHAPPNSLSVCFLSTGFFPPKHPEAHGVHMSQRQELHYQQGDKEPLSVLPPSEVLRSGNVQRV